MLVPSFSTSHYRTYSLLSETTRASRVLMSVELRYLLSCTIVTLDVIPLNDCNQAYPEEDRLPFVAVATK